MKKLKNMLGKKVNAIVKEEDLYPAIREYFSTNYKLYREVPFFNKRVDVVGIRDNEIIAIEMKLRDWKTAFRQAWVNQLFANKSYVAMWHKYIGKLNYKYFVKYNVGIIEVKSNGTIKIIYEPHDNQPSKEMIRKVRIRLR